MDRLTGARTLAALLTALLPLPVTVARVVSSPDSTHWPVLVLGYLVPAALVIFLQRGALVVGIRRPLLQATGFGLLGALFVLVVANGLAGAL